MVVPPPWLLPDTLPPPMVGYLEQPEMAELVRAAVDLGWTLLAYEADHNVAPEPLASDMRGLAYTNWCEAVQASNLVAACERFDTARVLVWCGNGHHRKTPGAQWIPMGSRYVELAPEPPYCIDQLATVSLHPDAAPMIAIDDELCALLEEYGPPEPPDE